MKARTFAPRNLDIEAFIASGEALSGALPVKELPRLADSLVSDPDTKQPPEVSWSVQGRQVQQRVGGPQLWLDLSAQGEMALECQRCLQPVTLPVAVTRSIRFVKDEAAAAELDAESDEDVLALSRHFDLMALIEDELIMAQPIVPRHARCPTDVESLMAGDTEAVPPGQSGSHAGNLSGAEDPAAAPESTTASGKPNPFAVLASLKKDRS